MILEIINLQQEHLNLSMHSFISLVVFHCCNYFQTYMINHPILPHLNKQLPDTHHMLFNLHAVLFYLKFPLAAFLLIFVTSFH